MSAVCRGCGGTGIGAHVSPREAQLLQQKIYLIRADGEIDLSAYETADGPRRIAKRYVRVDAWHGQGDPCFRGRLAMSGTLIYVIAEFQRWLREGWQVEPGSQPPDKAACCDWCGGSGRAGIVLSVHNMEESLERRNEHLRPAE